MSTTNSPRNKKPQGTSRRDFLRKSTAAVAGSALVNAIGARSYAAGSDEIRIALIGTGGRGSGAVSQALHTSGPVKLVAAADAFRDRLDGALNAIARDKTIEPRIAIPEDSKYDGPLGFQKIMARDDIHLVILTTPPGLRPHMFEAAVNAGKHVFMEKPVATDGPGIRRVLAANEIAKKKNLKVGVGLQRHHQRPYIETVKRLQDGAIGDFTTFRVYWNGGGVWTRGREELGRIFGRKPTEMEYQVRNWYYFNWLCGDHITEQHIHNLDVANWVMNSHPAMAQGQGGRQVRTGIDAGEIYDHHFVEYTYGNGTKMFSQCRHIGGCWNSVNEYVEGTKGHSDISGWIQQTGGERWQNKEGGINPYQQEHNDLFEAIRKDTPYNEAEYGAHSTMTSILGRYATYSGYEISWDDALNWGKALVPAKLEDWDWNAAPPTTPDADGRYPIAQPGSFHPLMFDPRNKKEREKIQSTYKPIPGGYEKIG